MSPVLVILRNNFRSTYARKNDVVKKSAVIPADAVALGCKPHNGKSQYVAAHDTQRPITALLVASIKSISFP